MQQRNVIFALKLACELGLETKTGLVGIQTQYWGGTGWLLI